MNRQCWIVGPTSVRPAGPPARCFYCNERVGDQHAAGCTIRQRTVVVRVAVEMVVDVPEDWDAHNIEFFYNEGSSCTNNVLRDIGELVERLDGTGNCTCNMADIRFVREATEDDEAAQLVRVEGLES